MKANTLLFEDMHLLKKHMIREILKIYHVPDYAQDCKSCKCSGPLQSGPTCLSCVDFVEMLPTRVLSLHCVTAPVLTLLLAHSPLLVSDKVSAIGSLGSDFFCSVLFLFCFLVVWFWGFCSFFGVFLVTF